MWEMFPASARPRLDPDRTADRPNGAPVMTDTSTTPADPPSQAPALYPAFQRFDRFVGTWQMRGRTVGSDVENIVGTARVERNR